MQRLLVACAAVVCVLPVVLSQQVGRSSEKKFVWSVNELPDPYSYNTYIDCGRKNRSNICDPNGLIDRRDADKVDRLIRLIYEKTRCDCPKCRSKAHGYVVRVAVMPRMGNIFKHDNTTEDLLRNAQMFAYMLTQRWTMGDCNESVLILFSRFDGVLYTLTLPDANKKLKDTYVKRITMAVRHMFDDDETIGDGLYEMIERYMMVFENQKDKALRPKMAAQQGSGAVTFSPSTLLSLLLTAFSMLAMH